MPVRTIRALTWRELLCIVWSYLKPWIYTIVEEFIMNCVFADPVIQ